MPDALPLVRTRGWLGEAFVVETAPAATERVPVVLLPPFGYEDTSAYRPLRALADVLARAGHRVVRLDWPGLGDSAGAAEDGDLTGRMRDAVRAVVASLRARGAGRVAAIAVRAGGLVAAGLPGIDDLALWGVPSSGKAFLREERAFHRMAASMFGAAPAGVAPPAEGAVEAGGFLYAPATVASLATIDVEALLRATPPARLLILPRDGTTPPAAWSALPSDVTIGVAEGVGALLEDPYRSALSPAVADALRSWLALSADTGALAPPALAASIALEGGVRERVWIGAGGAGALSGVVAEPAGGAAPGEPWTLFFNAGGVRRSGPNRLWTTSARALARLGRPSLRFDVRDVGDSDGVDTPHADLEAMYAPSAIDDATAAWDAVKAMGAGSVEVVGLCSGAFLGAQVAARRPVARAVLFNGLAFVWNEEAKAAGYTAHIFRSLLDLRRWTRLLTGRIDARALARAVVTTTRLRGAAALARARGEPPPSPVDALLEEVRAAGTRLHLVSSAGDPSIEYLHRHVPPARRPRLTVLPGVDHTVRPVWAHAHVVALVTTDRPLAEFTE